MKDKISLKEYIILIVGMFVVAGSVYYIMMPSHVVIGSISGFIMVIANFIPLPVSSLTLIVNTILVIIGFIFIGKDFGAKTVITSILLPLYLRLFEIISPNVQPLTDDLLINVLSYVLVLGFGQALLFNINASTGGLDIVAKLINKYTHMDIGKALIISGFVTAATSILVYDKKILVASVLGTYISGVIVDNFIAGFNIRKKVCVLSPKYQEIQMYIIKELNRGATLYHAYGAWENEKRIELVTILENNELAKLLEYVNKIDPDAFITVATVGTVIGKWNNNRRY